MIAAVLCVCVASACGTVAADTGTRGHGDAGSGIRASHGASAFPAAAAVVARDSSLAAALRRRFTRALEAARFSVSPCPRVPAPTWVAPTAMRRPGASAARPPAGGEDPWLAEDKLKHFLVSFALTSIGYGAARSAGLGHRPAIAAAAGAGAAAGIWKELHDRATGGDVSARDLTWDAAGVALGGALSTQAR